MDLTRLRRHLRALVVVAAVLVPAGVAVAQEPSLEPTAAESEGHEGEGDGKLVIAEDHEEWVGIGIYGLTGLAAAAAAFNAMKQLRGDRPQASGKWRPR